jgi:hypothetical protein
MLYTAIIEAISSYTAKLELETYYTWEWPPLTPLAMHHHPGDNELMESTFQLFLLVDLKNFVSQMEK